MSTWWPNRPLQTRNQRGVALFAAIAGMVLLSTMIAALVILGAEREPDRPAQQG